MELIVYDRYKQHRVTLSPDDSSQHHSEIGGDDYISLSCTFYDCILLEVGDYMIFQGEKFWITESYIPKQEGLGRWTYSVKFYGAASIIKDALMLNPDGTPVFVLTAPAREHLALVVKNLNRWMGNITDWKVGNCISTENLVIDYSEGVYCNEALKKIADEAETEWWIEGMTVNIGKCEIGEEIPLAYNKGLRNIERDNADNVKFFTRLFPIGSTKNIDAEKYGYSTLQLPSRNAYVEKNTEYGTIEHYEKEAFNDIFPRSIGVVSSVRSEVAKDDDGNEFTIYYFSDGDLNFDPNKYEIANLVKHVIFQDGELAGRDFEVNYNSTKKEFEIITTWPYDDDTQLPGGLLIPAKNDKYIMYNIRMPDEYYPMAEQEYATAVDKFMEEHCLDRSVYKSPTDYTYIEANGIELKIGQRVRLESDLYFPKSGFRSSRITVVSQNLLRPGQADIEISDVLSQTSQSKLTDDLENVRTEIKTATTTFPDIIRSWETTPPTDNNLFSALRILAEIAGKAISKKKDDTAEGVITFLKGLLIGNGTTGIDKNGNASLLSVISNKFESLNFKTGVLGSGLTLKIDENGDSYLEIDRALFRKSATFVEILIQSLRHVGGQIILTPASIHCIKVEETEDGYKCYYKKTDGDKAIHNEFRVGDFARSQTFNIQQGVSHNVSNSYYWRRVIAADDDSDYIELSKTDCDTNSTIPQAGDDIVQLGNDNDPTRQAAIVLSAYGNDAPYFKLYRGINSYALEGKEIVNISRSEVMIIADTFKFSTGESLKDYIENMTKEEWTEGIEVNAGTTLPFCGNLYRAKVKTSNPPCEINQNIDGSYIKNNSGEYICTSGADSCPIVNSDWDLIVDNTSLENRVRNYSDSLFLMADDKITLKVSKDAYEADQLGVQKRLSLAESSIIQQAESIALRVTKTDYDQGLENLKLSDQQYAEAQKTLAISEANATTEQAKTDLQAAIDTLDQAKANADDVYSKAVADGKITASEQTAIQAANAAAEAAKNLAVTTANAYADGVVSEEEARAITDAQKKADAAKQAAINTAATDATNKANAAVSTAKSYTDSQILLTNKSIGLKVSRTELQNYNKWVAGTTYRFPSMLSFGNMLVQPISSTTNPPCEIAQDYDGSYNQDIDGSYVVISGANGKPIFNSADWVLVMDNSGIFDQARNYTDAQIVITDNKITNKVSQTTYTVDQAGIISRVAVAESAIAQTSQQISLKVWQSDISASSDAMKSNLLATGIDIANRKVTVTADTFVIKDNSGNISALFSTGSDGVPRIKGQFIEADKIVAKQLNMTAANGISISITPQDAVSAAGGIYGTSVNGRRVLAVTMSDREGSNMDSAQIYLSQYSGSTEIASALLYPFGLRIIASYGSNLLSTFMGDGNINLVSTYNGVTNNVLFGLIANYSGISITGYRPILRMNFPDYNTAGTGEVYKDGSGYLKMK